LERKEIIETDLSSVNNKRFFNKDIAPTSLSQRTWGTYNFASLWIGMSVSIPTYMLAGGLIAGGMNWWQAILTIGLGNIIVLIPLVLNAHGGTKYGIPFPVLARSSFGILGSNIPAILRALVACGWFGIQTWIGGEAVTSLINLIYPGFSALSWGSGFGFMIFWGINIYFIIKGIESIRLLESLAAPFLIIIGLGLLIWAYNTADGFGPMLNNPGKFKTGGGFWKFFIPSLTGMVGYWATLSLNIPDFSRYAKSQKSQILGQSLGLPTAMILFSFIGVAVTSATVVIFGEAIWDPVDLISKFNNPLIVSISLVALMIATLSTNIAANVVSPANDFSNLAPKSINFTRAGLITAVAGIFMMPWKLLGSYEDYIHGWLVGYSGLLGPVTGILICDYFIVRKKTLEVKNLYDPDNHLPYLKGYSKRAIIAFIAGSFIALIGLIIPLLEVLYDYSWFVGFALSFLLYWVLMRNN
jgi:NCS1 family nucleobase:cation symporter-1